MIDPARQRKGFGSEAVGAVIDYCRSRLKVRRVAALIAPDNVASIRLAQRVGLVCEGGPMRHYWLVGERSIDAMIYASVSA